MPGSRAARVERLKGIPLFAGLSQRSLRAVLDHANEVELPANHVLVQPGLEGSGLFIVEDGTVAVERGSKKTQLGPGEFFGELALLTKESVRTARVRSVTPVRLLAIARDDFRRLLESEPKLALTMLETLATRLARSS